MDFSAFESNDVEIVVQTMRGRVKKYIFISSDSVYMVCKHKDSSFPCERVSEECAVRPIDAEWSTHLIAEDEYGHGKLCCEEILTKAYKQYSFPFTSLRLPDVLGPYDTTKRHWRYQLWVKASNHFPVYLPQPNKKLSFVYREDVVSAIFAILASPEDKVNGEAFNLAMMETPTLKEYLELVGEILQVKPKFVFASDFPSSDSEDSSSSSSSDLSISYFPSVDFGPIDISKVLDTLPWKPTSLKNALIPTCLFFEEAWYK